MAILGIIGVDVILDNDFDEAAGTIEDYPISPGVRWID